MNAIINIFFIFVFLLLVLILFNIPNIESNPIVGKIIIFLLLFIYQFVLLIIVYIVKKCKIDIIDIIKICTETSIIGVIGYSVFNDLHYMGVSDGGLLDSEYKPQIYLSVIITSLLTLVNVVKLLFGYMPYQCVGY